MTTMTAHECSRCRITGLSTTNIACRDGGPLLCMRCYYLAPERQTDGVDRRPAVRPQGKRRLAGSNL